MDKNPQMAVKRSKANSKVYRSVDYSGFFERLFARGVDLILAAGFGYLIYRFFGLVSAVICAVIFDLVVRIVTTFFWGGTVGKLLFGVRVISRCLKKLSFAQVVVREFFRYISIVFAFLGYITIIFNRRKRAWHDMASCTAVTSGGREEARYARGVYAERPEKWYKITWAIITGLSVAGLLFAINTGAKYMLYDKGMFGFTQIASFATPNLIYKMSPSFQGYDKKVIQIGDTNGDGKYETFREGVDENGVFIRNVRLSSVQPIDGSINLNFDKAIIQYKLLDMDNDKKDELAVLLEDKTLKIYNMDDEITEMGALEPLEYSDIVKVTKGKPDASVPWRLYILGDSNKLTVVSMGEGGVGTLKLELPVSGKLVDLDMGVFNGKNYLVGASDNGELIFYSYDGKGYSDKKHLKTGVSGKISISIKDMNMDKKNEIFLWSPENDERQYPVMAAYDVSGENMKTVWDGGRYFVYDGEKYTLSMDDAADVDNDGKLEAYMLPKKVSGQDGSYSIFIFSNDKTLLMANDFMRTLSLSVIK